MPSTPAIVNLLAITFDEDGAAFEIFFDMLKTQGLVAKKFGRAGRPRNKTIKITGDLKYLHYGSAKPFTDTHFGES